MRRSDRAGPWVVTFMATVAACGGHGCCEEPPRSVDGAAAEPEGPEEPGPPRIDPPPGVKLPSLPPGPTPLPADARARFPLADGQSFFVTLPLKNLSPTEEAAISRAGLVTAFIAPTLAALGFNSVATVPRDLAGRTSLLAAPRSDAGVARPRGDLSRALPWIEYQGSRPAFRKADVAAIAKLIRAGQGGLPGDADAALKRTLGLTLAEFKTNFARKRIDYPFLQTIDGVPIEHMIVTASRLEGRGFSSIQGALVNRPIVETKVGPAPPLSRLRTAARQALRKVKGVIDVAGPRAADPNDVRPDLLDAMSVGDLPQPSPVLLPVGSDEKGIRLRHAWRLQLHARTVAGEGEFLLWLDAEKSDLLKLQPLFDRAEIPAQGEVYAGAPTGGTTVVEFNVDEPSAGSLARLRMDGAIDPPRVEGSDGGVAVAVVGGRANFAVAANAPPADPCLDGKNTGNINAAQVNVFAALYRARALALANGIAEPFPSVPWQPRIEVPCYAADSTMTFGFGSRCGANPACPGFRDFALDNTIIAHEAGHTITKALGAARFAGWCGSSTTACPVPLGWPQFHDLADGWADLLESSDCIGSWVAPATNRGVADCATSSEKGGLPRKHVADDSSSPNDHFPKFKNNAQSCGPYCQGQTAAAALWEAKQRFTTGASTDLLGALEFGRRFQNALYGTSFGYAWGGGVSDLYGQLRELEEQLLDESATSGTVATIAASTTTTGSGSSSADAILVGFARAGLFLSPYQCELESATCTRGAAVVEAVRGTTSTAPTFNVWTGPTGACNPSFVVEVATTGDFAGGLRWPSEKVNVGSSCKGSWTPSDSDLPSRGEILFYHVRTCGNTGSSCNGADSLQPGNGLWTVNPPSFQIP